MGFLEVRARRWLAVIAAAVLVAACGSSDTHKKVHPLLPDSGIRIGDGGVFPDASTARFGSSGSSGGTVMRGGGYILFGETGEVPGTSGLSTNPHYKMVGGLLGRTN